MSVAELTLTPYENIVDSAINDDGKKVEFTIDELDERAKRRAIDAWNDHAMNYDWWDYTYEDAIQAGAHLGIEIGTKASGKHTSPDIWFSGFWSQGDGCCYSGTLHLNQLKDCTARAKEFSPNESFMAIAAQGEALHTTVCAEQLSRRLLDEDSGDFLTIDDSAAISGNDRYYSTHVEFPAETSDQVVEAADKFVSDFADWIYKLLEAEYEYLTSDEHIEEDMRANDCLFDVDGSII